MNYKDAEALASKIRHEAPDALATIKQDGEPEHYLVDVLFTLRFVVRDEGQWQRRKQEAERFKKPLVTRRCGHGS
jgi:hypothetical protein